MSYGLMLYAACTDFLIVVAQQLHLSYRDSNALLFFVLWPLVTALLAVIALVQRALLYTRRS
jgi:hypothetical protein